MPQVVFRCDASPTIGSGHVARCMALAQALRRRGVEVELISRGLPERVRNLLVAGTGALVHELPPPDARQSAAIDDGEPLAHAEWLPVAQKVDAEQTVALLHERGAVDWLIVDHYALDARWERVVRPHARTMLAIDDLADREHVCDALLDQNFFLRAESRYSGRVAAHTELMLGPKFALLRDEFAQARNQIVERDGRLRRIFVCFGSFDAAGQTLRALQAIDAAALDAVSVDVVTGGDHPQRKQIESFCVRRAFRIHLDAANVAELMAPADLAIGASGIMNWERAALSLPSIVTSLAENQHIVACDLAADRACIYLGLADEWREETLSALLRGLYGTPTLVQALGRRAGELTDGRGAQRVAARLLPEAIALRRAQADDADAIHAWRNAEKTRRYSGDASPIALDEHRKWFRRVLSEPRVALLIGERDARPVGVLRYDIDGRSATVSVYLVPGWHGKGLGTALLRAGSSWMRDHYQDVTQLRATIKRDNAASLEAFENAGYRLGSHDYMLDLRHG